MWDLLPDPHSINLWKVKPLNRLIAVLPVPSLGLNDGASSKQVFHCSHSPIAARYM